MEKFFLKLYYSIFRSKMKASYLERDEIKLSMRVLKNNLSEEKREKYSSMVFEKIEESQPFKKSQRILFYLPGYLEIPTQKYIQKWSEEKEIYIPSMNKDKFSIKKFLCFQDNENKNYVKFDKSISSYDGDIDLAIIPAIVFDSKKNRMGHGKGYYKNYLKYKSAYTIGVGYDFQIIDDIPKYWKDFELDAVITPNSTLK